MEESEFVEAALAQMETVLEKRLQVSALLENPADGLRLVRYCGGCLRDLMHLINQASTFREPGASKISSAAVDESIRRLRRSYKRPLGAEDFITLAKLSGGTVGGRSLDQAPIATQPRCSCIP